MQFRHGDVSQCFGAVDGTYFSHEVGIKYYRIAIKNYTFSVPVDRTLIANSNQTQTRMYVTSLIAFHSQCKAKQSFEQFPYTIANDNILVTPVVEGQLIEPLHVMSSLPQQFEFGRIKGTEYKVCYPSDVVTDYFKSQNWP